jgi:hypothetical protein
MDYLQNENNEEQDYDIDNDIDLDNEESILRNREQLIEKSNILMMEYE